MTTYTHPILSYVYRLDHPVTGEFYIGFRSQNVKKKIPSHLDLGIEYFTSSKFVKPRFNEFNFHIVAEFYDENDAYDFEQRLIYESWGMHGILNKRCHYGKLRLKAIKGIKKSPEHCAKISAGLKGKIRSHEHNESIKASILVRRATIGIKSGAVRGSVLAKDVDGNTYKILNTDPRWISGELVGINSGRAGLFSHINTNAPKYDCEFCGKQFSKANYFMYHGEKCGKDHTHPATKFRRDVIDQEKIHHRRKIACQVCGMLIANNHMVRHVNTVKCQVLCEKNNLFPL